MAGYTIIAFGYEIADVRKHDHFIARTNAATTESLKRLIDAPQKFATAPLVDIRRVLMPEDGAPPQYQDFSSVYFLNDTAMLMCQEIGLELQQVGHSDSPPLESDYQLQAQYLPFADR